MKKYNPNYKPQAETPELKPTDIIGFAWGNTKEKGFVQSTGLTENKCRYNLIAVEGIHRHNIFWLKNLTWLQVFKYLTTGPTPEVYVFDNEKELLKWLAE